MTSDVLTRQILEQQLAITGDRSIAAMTTLTRLRKQAKERGLKKAEIRELDSKINAQFKVWARSADLEDELRRVLEYFPVEAAA